MSKTGRKVNIVVAAVLLVCTITSFAVYGESWNGEGTGGEVGSATTNTYVANTSKCSGIRVTIVDDSGARVDGTKSVDYMWTVSGGANAYHISGKRSKIEFRSVSNVNDLNLVKGGYTYRDADEFASETVEAMPSIVIHSGSNITAIRNWLTNKRYHSVPNKIAKDCGLSPTQPYEGNDDADYLYRNTMCKYNYHILIEPVGSVVVQGVPYVGTATELAFIAQQSGCAWNYLGSYIDMQLPLSMYLSYTQLGIPAATFKAERQSREDIITYLGCAITTYQKDGTDITDNPYLPDDDPQPEIAIPTANYSYHTDTDVYTSVKITNTSGKDIVDTGWVEFTITDLGQTLRMENIALPAGGSQLAYCSWHTPSKGVSSLSITVTCSDGISIVTTSGNVSRTNINCSISSCWNEEPPDPRYEDERGSWTYPTTKMEGSASMGATWGHWEYTTAAGADKEIDVWYYHESGSYSYHTTGNQLYSATQINSSSYYRYVSEQYHPAVYDYGEWETHTDELYPGSLDLETNELDNPVPTKTVVTYLGTNPYVTTVSTWTRDDLAWRNEKSLSNSVQSSKYAATYYTVDDGTKRTTKPSASQDGQVLKKYTFQRTMSDGSNTYYIYSVTSWTAGYGSWVSSGTSTQNLSKDYGTTGTYVYPTDTKRVWYKRTGINYLTKTYTGETAPQDAVKDTAVWSKKTDSVTYYKWKQRTKTLITEAYTDYYYEMYDTSWNDSGSYWSTGKMSLSTQQKSWKWIEESVSVVASAVITPDDRCPTDYEEHGITYMKSGYGVNLEYTPVITTLGKNKAGNTASTGIQRMEAWFPEFGFNRNARTRYSRLLQRNGTDESGNAVYTFKKNKYSRFESRVHFTPLWYPDDTKYVVRVNAYDLWTPAGQISLWTESDPIMIADGTFYDDWAIGLYEP